MVFGFKVLIINCLVFLGCSFATGVFWEMGPERSGEKVGVILGFEG
jgi:hypothetical protein